MGHRGKRQLSFLGEVAVSGCSSTTAEPFIHHFGTTITPLLKSAGLHRCAVHDLPERHGIPMCRVDAHPSDYTFNLPSSFRPAAPVSTGTRAHLSPQRQGYRTRNLDHNPGGRAGRRLPGAASVVCGTDLVPPAMEEGARWGPTIVYRVVCSSIGTRLSRCTVGLSLWGTSSEWASDPQRSRLSPPTLLCAYLS